MVTQKYILSFFGGVCVLALSLNILVSHNSGVTGDFSDVEDSGGATYQEMLADNDEYEEELFDEDEETLSEDDVEVFDERHTDFDFSSASEVKETGVDDETGMESDTEFSNDGSITSDNE